MMLMATECPCCGEDITETNVRNVCPSCKNDGCSTCAGDGKHPCEDCAYREAEYEDDYRKMIKETT